MEIEEFSDNEILMEFFCRNLYYELEVNDLPESLIQKVIEERSVVTDELPIIQKMVLDDVMELIESGDIQELQKFLDEKKQRV